MTVDKSEYWARFGKELRRRRLEKGHRYGNQFAKNIGISNTYLSQIERAYNKPERKPTEPGDEILASISKILDWPLLEIRTMLGQIPPEEADEQASEHWKQMLRQMELKLGEMPLPIAEKIIGLWEEQLTPHYELYQEFAVEERQLQEMRDKAEKADCPRN